MKFNNKTAVIVGSVLIIVVLLLVGYRFVFRGSSQPSTKNEALPTDELIPTVDSSVNVNLSLLPSGHDIDFSVKNIPNGTATIEYSFSYNTQSQGIQGVIGTVNLTGGEHDYDINITLGTCSSGKCVYHQVVGSINLSLKFNGNYGVKVFQKDFSI